MAKSKRPEIVTPSITLKPPPVKNRPPDYRAFDKVVPVSRPKDTDAPGIPACVFGKNPKPAKSCKVRLFFADNATAAEMTTRSGTDFETGAYLRLCGPKTNDKFSFIPVNDTANAVRRAKKACECIDSPDGSGEKCATEAFNLAGVKARRKKRSRK